ncbi:MAG TPA: autotransporter outer membrane beta-barrel domain-containing protein [Caulobacteraceae bacterium]|jgi:hypothetical protein
MNRLLVAVALAPLTFAAAQASAQTITASTSTPIVSNGVTVTVNPGVSVTPTAAGTSTTQAAAVTQNVSATPAAPVSPVTTVNSVSNQGTISYTGVNFATGVLVNGVAGAPAGSIANVGTISLTETTNYVDTNNDGIVDSNGKAAPGQYAAGNNRYGIQTAGGQFNGGIASAGTISIIGENSAGILIGSGGITGNLSNLGTISVTGGNSGTSDVSYGIDAKGAMGSVNLGGTITALGQNAIGVNLGGPVTGFDVTTTTTTDGTTTTTTTHTPGSVDINGTITATGYRSTTAATAPSELALIQNQASSELLQGGPALAIGGSVANGISLDAPIAASGSGSSTTAAVAGAVITSDGRAPAVLIGSGAGAINIGAFGTRTVGAYGASSGYGLIIGGTISGLGVYDTDNAGNPVGANGVQIGVGYINSSTGLMSGSGSDLVTITNGIMIDGTILASGISRTESSTTLRGGDVTALHIGDVAVSTPLTTTTGATTHGAALNVTGTISAASTSTVPVNVTAIQLDQGASVPSLYNAGTIQAGIGGIAGVLNSPAAGGTQGDAVAISDKSGSLAEITNSGTIAASITPIDVTQQVVAGSRTIAIDLSANTTGATVTQVTDPNLIGTTAAGVTTTFVPSIRGDVLFGSGNGVLNLQAGSLVGGMLFGAGSGNDIEISGGAVAVGQLSEAAGGQLKINVADGLLAITAPVSNPASSTTFGTTQAANGIGVSSLHIGSSGQLVLSVGATSVANSASANNQITGPQLVVAPSGSATFDDGSKLGLNFTSKLTQTTTYNLIEASAGNIHLGNVGTVLGGIPYLYTGAVSETAVDSTHDAVSVTVSRKTAKQLGFNTAESSAYDAVYAAFDTHDTGAAGGLGTIEAAMLSADNRASFLKIYDQMLPDYSGGPFEDLVLGQQGLARAEAESPAKMEADTNRGWVQEIGYVNNRNASDAANGYNGKGFGLAGGIEHASERSAVGVAAAFISSSVHDLARSDGSSQGANAVEAGVYWRSGGPEGLNLGASVNGGVAVMESRRVLMDQSGTDAATLYRQAKGSWIGGLASASFSVSYKESFGRYYVKPEVLADYVMLYEQAYSEHGGGGAYDLTVGSKLSKEAIVQADMVLGATYGTATRWSPELTVGWRQSVYGGPADVTANFAGGQSFKLSPNYQDKGGLVARLGVRASGNFADFSANAGGVFRTGYDTYDARASARFLF